MKINMDRLLKNLQDLKQIGYDPQTGGINRALGDQSDREARDWLCNYWKTRLCRTAVPDAIANLWVTREGTKSLPPIVIGSHHDCVPNGGMLDGALGVLTATEILQTFDENGYQTRHPFCLISFTGEEPNPFQVSTLGSKVVSGRLQKEDLKKLRHRITGEPLQKTLEQIGGDVEKADTALLHPGDVAAYLELHIEQGRRLFDQGLPVSGVSCITGIYRENITVYGEANHAGTTIMRDRRDALLAASELMLAYEKLLLNENQTDTVGTVGYLKVTPNAANIIPGRVDLILELRTSNSAKKEKLIASIGSITAEIEARRHVHIERMVNLDQPRTDLDDFLRNAVCRGIQTVGEKPIELASMAGHDAANMERVTRSGMIFVQSIDGKSHCPSEKSDPASIQTAANAMLETVLLLDKELDA